MDSTQPEDPLARTELTFLLGMAFQLTLAEFVRRVTDAGYQDLRPVHGMVFQVLRDQGRTSSELATHLGVTKQAAGQIVEDLERRGYLRRGPHPDGGRRRLIELTDQAVEHLAVAGRTLHQLEAELTERLQESGHTLPRAELAALIRTLNPDPHQLPPLRPLW